MPENNLRPRMLNQYPGYGSVLDYVHEKFLDTLKKDGLEKAIQLNEARSGTLRNYSNLSLSELGRQLSLEKARQLASERNQNEEEMQVYSQATADRIADAKRRQAAMIARNQRLNQDESYNPGVGVPESITNVREVGPAGYQPGYQGGMDFADLQGMSPPGPTYRPPYEGGMDFANLLGMSPPPPTNKASSIVDASLDTGQQIARDQNRASTQGFFSDAREGVSSLFGDIGSGLGDVLTSPFFQRILAIMARPEFQDPRGIGPGIVGAAAGLKEDEKAAAKLKREEQRLENEAAQLDFLNKLKLAQARRDEERLRLAQEAAGKPKGTALPFSKEFGQGVENLVKSIAADYISDEAGYVPYIYGSSRDEIASEIAAEARSLVAASGNIKNIRQAIEEVLAIRQGKAPPNSTSAKSTNKYENVKEK